MTTTEPQEDRDYFSFLTYTWDVTAAAALATDLPVQPFTVRSAFQVLPFVRVDEEHAKGVDLSLPLLTVHLKEVDSAFVIDGWHRLHRAAKEGVESLPCKLLTDAQERQVRLHGGDKGLPDRAARRARLLEERGGR